MRMIRISLLRLAVPLALLLPLTVLIACTTDSGVGTADDAADHSIVFKVSSDGLSDAATRGEILNNMVGTFGLMASQYEGSWGTGHALNFMYNEPVWGGGTVWQTSRGYFAPSSSYNLKFFAYFPHYEDVESGTDPIVLSDADLETTPSFVYTVPQNAEDQQDLMYAVSDEMHANLKGRLDTVRLQFHHLLTAVSFAAGESSEAGYVRRVRLTDLYYRGTFDFADTEIVTDVSKKRDCWVDLDLKSGGVGEGFRHADADKTFLLLPQRKSNGSEALHANATLIVEYETGGHTFTFSKNLSELSSALATPGRNILLNLTVTSVQRMKISATITDWGHGANFDGAVSDQPVVDLGVAISDWGTVDSNGSTSTDFITGPQPADP